MKKIFILISTFFIVFLGFSQTPAVFEEPVKGPKIAFKESSFDFGEIKQGDVVEHVFVFENTGKEPLILTDVRTTCGCTVPKWPKEPLAPGASASITVQFNSRGKIGMQNKVITVLSNSNTQQDRVMIKTNIVMPTTEG
jgi:hypothetical protein